MSDEKKFLIQLQLGNAEAFEVIYWRYHSALYSNILKIIKDPFATEDLLQEVFVALWKNKESLDVEKPVANWLFVVSYNKSLSHLKETSRINGFHSERPETPVSDNGINNNYSDQQWEMLQKGLKMLSPQKRKVFQLCRIESKTYKEAAVEMHISRHTVKEYLGEAISFLKKFVQLHIEMLIFLGGAFQIVPGL